MTDEVQLVMPADPEFLRLARVTAMGLASRLSFTIDEIDDLRIAIDELLFGLIGTKGRDGKVVMTYRMRPDGLEVEGSGQFANDGSTSPGLSEFSQLILDAVADEHELDTSEDGPRFRLTKRRS
jgi:serine/threonine-protein kinase RsbW